MELPENWAVFTVDRSHRILEANDAFRRFYERHFGLRPRAGESVMEGLSAPERKRLAERFAAAEGEGGFTVEENYYRDGERSRFVAHYCPVFDGDRGVRGFRVFLEDVTERRELEAELKRTRDALEESYRMRETVFSVLGHDLRGPISQINALVYLMRDRPDFLDPQRIRNYADDLDQAGAVLTHSLENLLQWARIHRGPLSARASTFVADKVIRESINLLRVDIAKKQLNVGFNEGDPVTVETDRLMLAFVVRNVLANAVKFTPKTGTVEVEQHYDESGYRVAVKDSGKGIPPARLDTLREKKVLDSMPGTEGERGMGLGLRVCQLFAECMGGCLEILSEEGKGTTVTLLLPPSVVSAP